MFHHKPIKRFGIEGTLYDEADVDRLKREYLALVVLQMKSNGYIPRADIDPDFTVSYLGPRAGFQFQMSVYGVYVGKKKAQQLDRLYGYRPQYANKAVGKDKKTRASGTT